MDKEMENSNQIMTDLLVERMISEEEPSEQPEDTVEKKDNATEKKDTAPEKKKNTDR